LRLGPGGIRVEGIFPDRKLCESLCIRVSGECKGQHLLIDAWATIVRINEEDNETALRFDALRAETWTFWRP